MKEWNIPVCWTMLSKVKVKAKTLAEAMDRIMAMPLDYIQDWLDGKNELEWRQQDRAKYQDFYKW